MILTDEEIEQVYLATFSDDSPLTNTEWTAARAIEAKVLDKLNGLEPVAWVSTVDRLPPDKTVVLAVVNGKIRLVERRWEYPTYEETFKAFWYWDDPNNDGQDWGIADVTHWMPIPLYALEE